MTPGTKLRLLREARDWSPEQLAKACVMRTQFVLQIEANEVPEVHVRTWQKLADVLDCSLEDFFTDDDLPALDRDVVDEVSEELRPLVVLTLRLVFLLGGLTLLSLLLAAAGYVLSLFV